MLSYERMQPTELLSCADLAARAFGDYEYFSIYVTNKKSGSDFFKRYCGQSSDPIKTAQHSLPQRKTGYLPQ